jgi:regulatory protein
MRPRSEFEVRSHLTRRGFVVNEVEDTIIKLKEARLVDDKIFAFLWKEDRDVLSPRGSYLLRQELKQKGIDPEIIHDLVQDEDDEDRAWRAVKRRFGEREVSRRKLISFLGRRGFDYRTTTCIVSKLEGHATE